MTHDLRSCFDLRASGVRRSVLRSMPALRQISLASTSMAVAYIGMEASRTCFALFRPAIYASMLPLFTPLFEPPTLVTCRQKRSALTSDHLLVICSNLTRRHHLLLFAVPLKLTRPIRSQDSAVIVVHIESRPADLFGEVRSVDAISTISVSFFADKRNPHTQYRLPRLRENDRCNARHLDNRWSRRQSNRARTDSDSPRRTSVLYRLRLAALPRPAEWSFVSWHCAPPRRNVSPP